MMRKRMIRLALVVVPLAAGLGVAAYLKAGDADKLRPRDIPVRVSIVAPPTSGGQPAPAYYQAEVWKLLPDTHDLVSPLSFTLSSGPVDSHVVWVVLENYNQYRVRVRGVAANGTIGAWSGWSDLYDFIGPGDDDPPPPGD